MHVLPILILIFRPMNQKISMQIRSLTKTYTLTLTFSSKRWKLFRIYSKFESIFKKIFYQNKKILASSVFGGRIFKNKKKKYLSFPCNFLLSNIQRFTGKIRNWRSYDAKLKQFRKDFRNFLQKKFHSEIHRNKQKCAR